MKPIKGYEEARDFSEVVRIPAGPQKCKIVKVTDVPEKEYLEFCVDVVDGDYKGYFQALADRSENKEWPRSGKFIRSYKESALGFFKGAITAIEKTNQGYDFLKTNWNEKSLEGKYVVVNFREEEFLMDGEVKTTCRPYEFRSAEALKEGKIKVPEKLTVEKPEPQVTESRNLESLNIPDSELPF